MKRLHITALFAALVLISPHALSESCVRFRYPTGKVLSVCLPSKQEIKNALPTKWLKNHKSKVKNILSNSIQAYIKRIRECHDCRKYDHKKELYRIFSNAYRELFIENHLESMKVFLLEEYQLYLDTGASPRLKNAIYHVSDSDSSWQEKPVALQIAEELTEELLRSLAHDISVEITSGHSDEL